MNVNQQIFKDPEALANQFSDVLMYWIACSSGKIFHLAISGGNTPNLLFLTLASKYADTILWQKTHFWWVDERMVSPTDPESNFGTAQHLLFSKIRIPEQNIHRIRGEKNPLSEAVNYEQKIDRELTKSEGWPVFDLILLGMGTDGHTASIFPNRLDLFKSDHLCEVSSHPGTLQRRITMTGKVINHAAKICFLVTGINKAERLAEIWSEGEKAKLLPASYIQPVQGELLWYMDEQAAHSIC